MAVLLLQDYTRKIRNRLKGQNKEFNFLKQRLSSPSFNNDTSPTLDISTDHKSHKADQTADVNGTNKQSTEIAIAGDTMSEKLHHIMFTCMYPKVVICSYH